MNEHEQADTAHLSTNIWNAMDVVSIAWRETEAMLDHLADEFGHQPYAPEIRLEIDDNLCAYYMDSSESVCLGYAYQWGVKRKASRGPWPNEGWLLVQAVLGSQDGNELIKIPHVIVAFSTGGGSDKWSSEDLEGPYLTDDDDGYEGSQPANENRIVWYEGNETEEAWWQFSLPLVELESVEELKRCIVEPVRRLLIDGAHGERHPDTWRCVEEAFRFRVEKAHLVLVT